MKQCDNDINYAKENLSKYLKFSNGIGPVEFQESWNMAMTFSYYTVAHLICNQIEKKFWENEKEYHLNTFYKEASNSSERKNTL